MSELFNQLTRIAYAAYVPKEKLDAMLQDKPKHTPGPWFSYPRGLEVASIAYAAYVPKEQLDKMLETPRTSQYDKEWDDDDLEAMEQPEPYTEDDQIERERENKFPDFFENSEL